MLIRSFVAALALAAIALPASAVVKVYDATPPHGQGGERILFTTTLCPPIQPSPGQAQGTYKLDDAGTGTVTVTSIESRILSFVDLDPAALTSVFGPGSYVFTTTDWTSIPTAGTVHPGSTAPGGTVDWGVLGGWVRSGFGFCIASPTTICTGGAQLPHGVTVSVGPPNSPTYDLGTWAFDSVGDFAASAPYVFATYNGGTSNHQHLLRGTFVGGGVPALPLVGATALAFGLLVAGARSALRRR